MDPSYLVEVENQIQFADIAEESIQHLNEEVDGFEIGQLIVVCVHAGTEEKTSISPVDDFGRIPEFHKVGLVFLISWCNQAMDLRPLEWDHSRSWTPEPTSPLSFTFSSSMMRAKPEERMYSLSRCFSAERACTRVART